MHRFICINEDGLVDFVTDNEELAQGVLGWGTHAVFDNHAEKHVLPKGSGYSEPDPPRELTKDIVNGEPC